MNAKQIADLRASLLSVAGKCGADLSGLEIAHITMDRTWGDACGLVFTGVSLELAKRCAIYFRAWAARHLSGGNYDTQRSFSREGECFAFKAPGFGVWQNETAEKWYMTSDGGEVLRSGYAQQYVYYPCAD